MNIINKTLLPMQNVPEGGATIDVRVYNIETEMYLEGTALTNSYTITPNKPSYEAGETVSILLKKGLGSSAERTFQKTLVDGVNVIELAYSGNFLKLIAYPSEIGVQPYNIAIAPLNRYIRASSSDPVDKIASVTPVGTLSGDWYEYPYRAYRFITINIPSGSYLRFLNPTTSTFITPYLGTNTTRRIIDWGNFRPNTVTIESPFNIKPLEGQQVFPTKLPSIWTSLNSILHNVEGVYDVPSTWDLTNITNIMGIMKGKKDISTFPSNLFVKSYQNMQSAFSDCTFTEDVDLSLIDYSETTNLRNFNYQTNPMTTPSYFAEYYDKMLKKWVETIDPTRTITVHMHSKYSSIGEEYRNILLDRGWIITDLGLGEYITVNITTSPSQGNFTISGEKSLYRVGDKITISGTSEGFIPKTQTYTLVEGVNNINFELTPDELFLTVTTNPSDANITVTYNPNKPFYTYGETVEITVDSDMYASQTRTVTMTQTNQVEHFVLVRDRYTLTPTSKLNNVTFTKNPNKVAYYPNEIVTIVASKDGYLTTTKQVKMGSDHMTVEVNPVNESDAFEVEFEYVPEVISYGGSFSNSTESHSMVYFGTEKAYDKETFTKEELIDAGAIENGRIKLRFLPSDNISTTQRYITHFSRFQVNIPAGNNYAPKIWINTMPSWVIIGRLVVELDLQYCAEPLDRNLLITYDGQTEISRYEYLLSNIGRGVNSALKFSAISHWDFSRFTDFKYLFANSYIDFNIGLMNLNFYSDNMQWGSHFVGFIENGMIVDPAKYDDFLHSLLGSGISRQLDCGRSKYTPYGNIARQQLDQVIDIIDGGMVDPLTYPLVLNINVPIDTLTKTPNKSQYEVGETVQLFITKNGYEDYSYTHTIQKYRENNILNITMVEKTYFPTVVVRDEQNNIIPNATITLTPNKQSYLVGEEVLVSATKDGYSIEETYHTIVNGDNTVNLILTDISMDITYTVGTSYGTPSMSFYLINDIPVKVTNFDGTETLYDANVGLYQTVVLLGSLAQGASTTIKIKPIGNGNVGIAYIDFSPMGHLGLSHRDTIAIEKWGRVTYENTLGYLFEESAGNISKIPMLPNTNNFEYIFYGLSGIQGTEKPYVMEGALSEWTNVAIGNGRYMFAYTQNLPLDPRGFDLTNATDISNIFYGGTLAPINGQNAYDLWLIHLAQNYLNKALSFNIGMKYTSVGESARQQLVNAGWTIQDNGLEQHTLVVNTTPADATVTLNPNQASYQVGDVVTITVSSPDYVTQTITHTIVQGVNTVDVVLEESLPAEDGKNSLFQIKKTVASEQQLGSCYVNPTTGGGGSVDRYSTIGGTVGYSNYGQFVQVNFGDATTGTTFDDLIELRHNQTSLILNRITVAPNMEISIMKWGAIKRSTSTGSSSSQPLIVSGKVKYIRVIPSSLTDIRNIFNKNTANVDYTNADFSGWIKNGVKSVPITYSPTAFSGLGTINLDPRCFDFTNCTNMAHMFMNTSFESTEVYDNFLIYLANNFLSKKLNFSYGGKYTSAGASARAQLVSAGWTITDGGLQS